VNGKGRPSHGIGGGHCLTVCNGHCSKPQAGLWAIDGEMWELAMRSRLLALMLGSSLGMAGAGLVPDGLEARAQTGTGAAIGAGVGALTGGLGGALRGGLLGAGAGAAIESDEARSGAVTGAAVGAGVGLLTDGVGGALKGAAYGGAGGALIGKMRN
jgi:hypothetical protein